MDRWPPSGILGIRDRSYGHLFHYFRLRIRASLSFCLWPGKRGGGEDDKSPTLSGWATAATSTTSTTSDDDDDDDGDEEIRIAALQLRRPRPKPFCPSASGSMWGCRHQELRWLEGALPRRRSPPPRSSRGFACASSAARSYYKSSRTGHQVWPPRLGLLHVATTMMMPARVARMTFAASRQ